MKTDQRIQNRVERLRATNPRYSDWPELRTFIWRALPEVPKAPTPDHGPLVHRAYAMMANRPNTEWFSLLIGVERELIDRAMIYEGSASPWDEA